MTWSIVDICYALATSIKWQGLVKMIEVKLSKERKCFESELQNGGPFVCNSRQKVSSPLCPWADSGPLSFCYQGCIIV